jgi:hypothetical protein
MRRRVCLIAATVGLILALAAPLPAAGKRGRANPDAPAAGSVADEDVRRSIEKGREWLTNQQQNGAWPEKAYWHSNGPFGHTELATMTLLYTGSHPTNSTVMVNALSELVGRKIEYVYARSARTMAYAYALKGMKTPGPKRDQMKLALTADAQWLVSQQKPEGNWGYGPAKQRPDFSNTQFAILALWEAAKAGVEIPNAVWQRTLDLYLKEQSQDGAWSYGPGTEHPNDYYGSMTAAGLATIYICTDMLNLSSGCPCAGGKSGSGRTDVDRRIELALKWLDANFTAAYNPPQGGPEQGWRMYWLYAVERVGLACGYKYFGSHNWFQEGASVVIGDQQPDGSWNKEREGEPIVTTCFAILFLYKGRAPILYNKLQKTPGGEDWKWDPHRADIANLTAFTMRDREEQFQWQIVSLKAPVNELHDAPILYISAETAPKFTDEEKKKLREFTDTGGTVLLEASCGAPAVREWFKKFVKEVWPEWELRPLPGEHGTFTDPTNPLKTQRPEIFGVDDGIRTCVFYAMDDISCPWQTKAVASKEYLFKWGFNLVTYATDHAPLRNKLGTREETKSRYTSTVKTGAKNSLTVARLKTDGDWMTNRNYKGSEDITSEVSKRASLTIKFDDSGVDATQLAGKDVAYMVGSKEVKMAADQQAALKDFLSKGGFLWAEASDGTREFDESFRKLATAMGLELKIVDKTEPLMTGNFAKALGYNLTAGVQFRRSLRIGRIGRPFAEFVGIYLGNKMVGVYSPLDIGFAVTPFEAYGCRGYQSEDAAAVATNILLCASDR